MMSQQINDAVREAVVRHERRICAREWQIYEACNAEWQLQATPTIRFERH